MLELLKGVIEVFFYRGVNTLNEVLVLQNLITLFIDKAALLVQHVIVFKEVLTDIEVALFNLGLGLFNTLVKPRMLNRLTRFHTDLCHYPLETFAAEQSHQIVIEGKEEF